MEYIHLSDSERVRDGISDMLTSVIGDHGYSFLYVDIPWAMFVIEVARRVEDKPEWFPHGKWATIQSMQERVDQGLRKLFMKQSAA